MAASEYNDRGEDGLYKVIANLQNQNMPLESLLNANDISVEGVDITVTLGQVVQAQSICMQDLSVLPPGIRDWAVSLTNRLIAELLKFSAHPHSSLLHPRNVSDSDQSGTLHGGFIVNSCEVYEDHAAIKKEDISEDEEDSMFDDESSSTTSDTLSYSGSFTGKKHNPQLTKSVPATYVYNFRGVRCPVCYFISFRGMKCVDELVEHVTAKHRERATPEALEKLRASNTVDKIIGHGMRYCDCKKCLSYMRANNLI